MPKLHELLAAKVTKEPEALALLHQHVATFKNNHKLFVGMRKTFTPNSEEEGKEVKEIIEEEVPITTTIRKETRFVLDRFVNMIELLGQIEIANQRAVESIVVDGNVLAVNIPVTFLLHLEKKAQEVISLIQAMGTMDPVAGFVKDPGHGEDIYVSAPIVRNRTNKVTEFPIVAPATDKHPAQVKEVTKDKVIGTTTTINWSGMITSAQKSALMERATKLKTAIAEARARANCIETQEYKINLKKVFSYITDGFDS